jgi:hypothetical protein
MKLRTHSSVLPTRPRWRAVVLRPNTVAPPVDLSTDQGISMHDWRQEQHHAGAVGGMRQHHGPRLRCATRLNSAQGTRHHHHTLLFGWNLEDVPNEPFAQSRIRQREFFSPYYPIHGSMYVKLHLASAVYMYQQVQYEVVDYKDIRYSHNRFREIL